MYSYFYIFFYVIATVASAFTGYTGEAFSGELTDEISITEEREAVNGSDGEEAVYISYDVIGFSEDIQNKYPGLCEAVCIHNEENAADSKATMNELYEWYLEDGMFAPYCNEIRVDEIYLSDRIFSCREYIYTYSGGAHGNNYAVCTNINPETGEELSLEDVLAKPENPMYIIDEVLKEQLGDKYEYLQDHMDVMSGYELDTYLWTISGDYIEFYFPSYEIASYASGPIAATVYFDEYPELVKDIYMN